MLLLHDCLNNSGYQLIKPHKQCPLQAIRSNSHNGLPADKLAPVRLADAPIKTVDDIAALHKFTEDAAEAQFTLTVLDTAIGGWNRPQGQLKGRA